MSAGLAASTVTPGSTAPDPSRTVPVMLLCAHAGAERSRNDDATTRAGTRRISIIPLPSGSTQPVRTSTLLFRTDSLDQRQSAIALWRLGRGPAARFARADLRTLDHVHQAVVLLMAGKFIDSRLDARPDHFRRPRPRPRRRIFDRELVLERLRIGDRQ